MSFNNKMSTGAMSIHYFLLADCQMENHFNLDSNFNFETFLSSFYNVTVVWLLTILATIAEQVFLACSVQIEA